MFLEKILEATGYRVAESMAKMPLGELESLVLTMPPCRSFLKALQDTPFGLIAEIKRASPSRGSLAPVLDAGQQAQLYEKGGAAALSVLTEPVFFHGNMEDLATAHKTTGLPVLRKDFILEPYQLYEARAGHADAVLLIAGLLVEEELSIFIDECRHLGMDALVEVHEEEEVDVALKAGAKIIGINNRNLKDFSMDMETTFKIMPLIPSDIIVVSESGIKGKDDARRLREAGVRAILVGEALVTSLDPTKKIKELLE